MELEQERTARRKGRPKSTKELKLEEIKLHEAEEYRTGMGKVMSRRSSRCLIILQMCQISRMKLLLGYSGSGIRRKSLTFNSCASSESVVHILPLSSYQNQDSIIPSKNQSLRKRWMKRLIMMSRYLLNHHHASPVRS